MFSSADRQSRLGSAPGGTTLASRAAIHGRRARAEMRLCFVVQRFGPEIAGGAESACRQFAIRMAKRGHDVHAATTCARDYTDWANVFPAGESDDNDVRVHRFAVDRRRDNDLFNAINPRVLAGDKPVPLHLQRTWMRMQGPFAPALPQWIEAQATDFDAVIFFTYLYWTTWAALPVAARLTTTVLH